MTDLGLVGVHHPEIGREVDVERVRVLGDQGPDRRLHLRDERGDGEIFEEELHLAGLDLREIKDVVDQAQQVPAGAVDLLQIRHQMLVA